MFNSQEKFLQDITESFERFGIKGESSGKGAVKDTVRLHMFDTIHNSSYIAIAKSKSEKKNADKVWREILEKDFIDASLDPKNKGDIPAAALIVPSEDIETVEGILKSKGLRPSVYQIFPGYIVAGLKRADVGKMIDDYKKIDQLSEDKAVEESEVETSRNDKNHVNTEDDLEKKTDDTEQQFQEQEKGVESSASPKKFTLGAKVAAAALLGVAAGFVPFAMKTLMDKNKIEDIDRPPIAEETRAANTASKYFESLKEGSPADMELLKSIAMNPSLTGEYLDKLANSPVGVEALQNPSVSGDITAKAAVSENEERRAAAAANPKTRPEDLYRLSSDKSAKVRSNLAKNPAISLDIMKKLASDEQEVKKSLLENMSLTPDILDMITKNTQPDCDFVRKMMANPCITMDVLRRNSVNPDECFRAGVASNPNTPPEILGDLMRDKNHDIMERALRNQNIQGGKLDDLFPTNWANTPSSQILDKARHAALENPKIKRSVMNEALASDPMKYSKNLAKNSALPSRLADEINRIAHGRKGLRKFMNDAEKLKTDKDFHTEMKNESDKYSGDVSVPLRKKLNADFANSVYDPARLAAIIEGNAANARGGGDGTGQNLGNDAGVFGGNKINSLDKRGNAPIFFSKNSGGSGNGSGGGNGNGGEMSKGAGAGDGKGEMALAAADDIVSDLMSDILPPVAKAVYGSSRPPKNSGGFGGNGSDSPWRAMNNNNDGLFDKSAPMDIMFKNACDRIDALQVLF